MESISIIEVNIDIFIRREGKRMLIKKNYSTGLFWKSPELLRNPNICGTQKGDVYAFAIILYEICGRKGPFGITEYEPKQIIELVRDLPLNDEKSQPFRPDIQSLMDLENCPDYLINCIQDCWHENPEMRPDFPTGS